jgi:aryl-alcohol dehydrogenase-like predicted oxidoreductase
VWAMNLLIQQGKILYWATSNHSAEQIIALSEAADRLRLIGPIMEQCIHSLLYRHVVEQQLQPAIARTGIGIAAFTPLSGGILAGKYNDGRLPEDSRFATIAKSLTEMADWQHDIALSREVGAVAADLGVTQAQLALAWVARQPGISTVLLGATRAEQITANLQALDVMPRLDAGVLARLDAACARRQALRQQTVCAKE